MNHLDGEQALIHARNRSIGNSDYRRTERQQEVLMAAFAKIKDLGVFDIAGLVKGVSSNGYYGSFFVGYNRICHGCDEHRYR